MPLKASNTAALALSLVVATQEGEIAQRDILALLSALIEVGVDVIKTENLCTFDGVKCFALGKGQ